MREKLRLDVPAELGADRLSVVQIAEALRRRRPITVPPRTKNEKVFVPLVAIVSRVVRLELRIFLLRPEHIFLVVIAADSQRWHRDGIQRALNSARRPDRIVRRVIEKEPPGRNQPSSGLSHVLKKTAATEEVVESIHGLALFVVPVANLSF